MKRKTKPAGTQEYVVLPGETIEKIALKWNTIPSEIQHLNRLVTRTIFPGQTLYVPDPDYVPPPLPPPVLSPTKNQLPDAIINELNNSNDSSHALSPTHQQTSTTTSTFNIFKVNCLFFLLRICYTNSFVLVANKLGSETRSCRAAEAKSLDECGRGRRIRAS